MKKLALPILFMVGIALFSCNGEIDNEGKTKIVQDSLNNVLPTWQALKIKVEENNTSMKIVVGDATFYKAPPEVKTKKAVELGRMILRIYGKGNYLEKGMLIVTNDVNNTSENPADGISIPINFEEMKKANGK